MIRENNEEKIRLLVLTGLFAALITLFTAYICHLPVGLNGGYIHFGDSLIYIAAAILPRPYAMLAAAAGGGMADLLTAPMWAPATIIIKALVVLPFTCAGTRILTRRNIIAPFLGRIIGRFCYFWVEQLIFGSKTAFLTSILGNVIQSGGTLLFYFALAAFLDKQDFKDRLLRRYPSLRA